MRVATSMLYDEACAHTARYTMMRIYGVQSPSVSLIRYIVYLLTM